MQAERMPSQCAKCHASTRPIRCARKSNAIPRQRDGELTHSRSQPRFTRHAVAQRRREDHKGAIYGVAMDGTQGEWKRDPEQRDANETGKEGADHPDVRSAAGPRTPAAPPKPQRRVTIATPSQEKGADLREREHEVWGRATRAKQVGNHIKQHQEPRGARNCGEKREETGWGGPRVREHSLSVDRARRGHAQCQRDAGRLRRRQSEAGESNG